MGEYQQVPRKVLIFDKCVEQVLRECSIYCPLSPDHVQSCSLCYVSKSIKDVNICLFDSATSFLFHRILSRPSLTAICTISVDTPSSQSIKKACSEISLVEEAVSQIDSKNLQKVCRSIYCGASIPVLNIIMCICNAQLTHS